MTKIIGVDLDEVLAELIDYILEYNDNTIGNKYILKEDIRNYYIYKIPGIELSIEDSINYFKVAILSDVDNYNIKKHIGAKEKLLEMKTRGFKFVIITARAEDHYGEYTRKWVELNYSGIFDNIIFANHFSEKSREKHEICLENGIKYMIEDNYDYATNLAIAGITTYLLEKPWNNWQDNYHENIIRIKSWEEIEV